MATGALLLVCALLGKSSEKRRGKKLSDCVCYLIFIYLFIFISAKIKSASAVSLSRHTCMRHVNQTALQAEELG